MKIKQLIYIALLVGTFPTSNALAQQTEIDRKDTWDVYGKMGISGVVGAELKRISPTTGSTVAFDWGFGGNYYLRNDLRLGLNYEHSKFTIEQNYSSFQKLGGLFRPEDTNNSILTESSGGLAYLKQWTIYNNIGIR